MTDHNTDKIINHLLCLFNILMVLFNKKADIVYFGACTLTLNLPTKYHGSWLKLIKDLNFNYLMMKQHASWRRVTD